VNLRRAAALAIGGYLLGSISFARIVGRRAGSGELQGIEMDLPGGAQIEYRGVSATSVAVRSGPAWGIATSVLDMAKAFLPTLVTRRMWPGEPAYLVVAAAVMVGHNYPLYHGFRGGKGQTTFYGSLLAIDPVAIPVTNAAGVAVGVGVLREMLAGYTLGMWFTIPWFAWRRRRPEVLYALLANGLFTVAMIPESRAYLDKRRSGELGSMSSWREFLTSYPALTTRRRSPSES
jgi:glycerol-3-phosphate acyltransferase PlsY